jgi:hypothetical protein
MAKLAIPIAAAVVTLWASPALACDEGPVARYTAGYYGYAAPMNYTRYGYYDDDYFGGYGYGGVGLGIARAAYWRNRDRVVHHRASFNRGAHVAPRAGGMGGIGRGGLGGGGRGGRR